MRHEGINSSRFADIGIGQDPQLIENIWLHGADAYKAWHKVAMHAGQNSDPYAGSDRRSHAYDRIASVSNSVSRHAILDEFESFETRQATAIRRPLTLIELVMRERGANAVDPAAVDCPCDGCDL